MCTVSEARLPVLRVERLVKHFRRARGLRGSGALVRAVDGVSVTVAPGETVGLVGESGSGKTTFARAALRLIEPTAGRVELSTDGRTSVELTGLGRRELRAIRRHVAMVFQDPTDALDPRMTIREILAEPARVHAAYGNGYPSVEDLVELVGLSPAHLAARPLALSGGQRQRVAIARAVATHPRLIVADEPVSALDVSVQAQILELLQALRQRLGLGCLFISHDLAVVCRVADRVAVMFQGQIVEEATPDCLINQPDHPYTRALIRAARRRL